MKKCPECGNPSYDGAPVCGNCGYNFPKPKIKSRKKDSIFQNEQRSTIPKKENIIKEPKVDAPKKESVSKENPKGKPSNQKSTLEIIKEKKLIIGAIVLITLIVILAYSLIRYIHIKNFAIKLVVVYVPTILLAFLYVWFRGLTAELASSAYRDIFVNYTIGFLIVSIIVFIVNRIIQKIKAK